MTLGIFQLIVNGFILKLATMILAPDFQISSFFMMIVTSVCISIMSSIVGIKND
ncbi:MAG: phage holin family protein [Streptococcus sp.]